jgi:glycogen synthase
MRVAQLGLEWLPERAGGANRHYHDLVRHLAAGGTAVRGLVAGSDRPAADTGGVVRAFCPSDAPLARRMLAVRRAARRLLDEFAPDIVASHFALYALPCLDLLRRRPFVAHFHGPWALEGEAEGAGRLATAAKLRLERAVYARARLCVAHTEAFARVLGDRYGVPRHRVRVVPGAIDTGPFLAAKLPREEARAALGWPANRPTVLIVRRLVRRMGLENAVAAMAEVRRRHPDALLMVGGRGPLAGELAGLVEAGGLGGHVRLLGYVPEEHLPLAYRAADLSVVPSVALEGFGLTTAESLAAGTPVLVTPVGGLPEVVRDLSQGLVVRGTAPADIAEGICSALSGRLSLPREAACRSYASSRFDWAVVAPMMQAVYEEALGG